MSEELKPCPWCGRRTVQDFRCDGPGTWWEVRCFGCHCTGPAQKTRADAIAAWNAGPVKAVEAEREACAKICDELENKQASKRNDFYGSHAEKAFEEAAEAIRYRPKPVDPSLNIYGIKTVFDPNSEPE